MLAGAVTPPAVCVRGGVGWGVGSGGWGVGGEGWEGSHGAGSGALESKPLPEAAWGRASPREPRSFSGAARALLGPALLPLLGLPLVCSLGSARASEAPTVLGTRRRQLQLLSPSPL